MAAPFKIVFEFAFRKTFFENFYCFVIMNAREFVGANRFELRLLFEIARLGGTGARHFPITFIV